MGVGGSAAVMRAAKRRWHGERGLSHRASGSGRSSLWASWNPYPVPASGVAWFEVGTSNAIEARWLVVAIAVGIVLVALGGVSFAAYRYDRASADRILPGVTVAGADVGGMTRVEAIEAVRPAVEQQLARPMTIQAAEGRGRPQPLSSAAPPTSERPWIKRYRRRSRLGSSRGYGIAFARSRSTSRSMCRSSAARAGSRNWCRDRATSGPIAARCVGRRGRWKGDVRPLAAGTRARHPCRREAAANSVHRGHDAVRLPINTVKPKIPDSKIGKTIVVDRTINQLSLYNRFDLDPDSIRSPPPPPDMSPPPGNGPSSTRQRTPPGPTRHRTPGAPICRPPSPPVAETRWEQGPSISMLRGSGSMERDVAVDRDARIAWLHPDVDARRRGDLSARADRHPRDRVLGPGPASLLRPGTGVLEDHIV